ncbi:methionine ABC transporter substrate-binding protein [Klebsiella pneumoniae subsp. ozaenae]|uniref:Methionine ABC transporter substrate-binding protein n=1 Tax=Klebsiella pneumoniae subsp. ozaenae TaxID=574 RepID=A0A377ZNI8_KLEPO|nr:methionine ABC transporter substrate-binding protein [Klebsiella pneumoniae subsp. ozaenae]
MKYAAFKLAGVALSLSLVWTSAQAAALRVAADPVPHAEILNYIKKIDPSLDLKVVELTSGSTPMNCWPVAMWMPTTSSMFPI